MQQRLKTFYPGTKVYTALVPQALTNQQNAQGEEGTQNSTYLVADSSTIVVEFD